MDPRLDQLRRYVDRFDASGVVDEAGKYLTQAVKKKDYQETCCRPRASSLVEHDIPVKRRPSRGSSSGCNQVRHNQRCVRRFAKKQMMPTLRTCLHTHEAADVRQAYACAHPKLLEAAQAEGKAHPMRSCFAIGLQEEENKLVNAFNWTLRGLMDWENPPPLSSTKLSALPCPDRLGVESSKRKQVRR